MARANLKRLEEGKLYYSISEVCSMTGLEQHVLRYWESEFPQLRPKKNRSGNRAYRSKEIKIIRYIKYLLYDELYTIPGAKKKMADANLADLEGQMTLIRVPAAPATPPDVLPSVPAGRDAGNGGEAVNGAAEDGDGSDVAEAGGPGAHAGEAAGGDPERLRGEMVRMLDELKDLLAHLRGAGPDPAAAMKASLEATAPATAGGPRSDR